MSDITGKSGVGKRVLDDHGNWRAVTTLPKSVQDEIKASQKVAAEQFKEKALRHNKDYQDHKAKEVEKNLKSENDALKDIIKEQGDMLAKINAKMELGAKVVEREEKKSVDLPVVEPVKPMTPKQKLIMEAEELGVDFEESMTKAEISELIEEFKTEDAIDGL